MLIDFPDKPKRKYDHQQLGKITVLPNVEFEVSVFTDPGSFPRWKTYTVGCLLFGCTCGVSFKTPDEALAYLDRQKANVPQYMELKAKRDAIAKRIEPLDKKWFATGEALFKLAESPHY